ncbi:MAG: hypothetical protein WBA23_13020 [Tunicatimonas sp.]|uniref:hypothetical protein n=1 Tax=Tunicatimonas sp. TaxID=1940096 RepID=UPI003C78747C
MIEVNYKGALSGGVKTDESAKEKSKPLVDLGQVVILSTKKKRAIQVLKAYDTSVDRFIVATRIKPKRRGLFSLTFLTQS